MNEKISAPGNFIIRQDNWEDAPCSRCRNTPCCRNLPLVPHPLETRSDFISLTLASCYKGIYPALRKSGEWVVYLDRDCRFLNTSDGKCSIHQSPRQSLVCKSFDARGCWYVDAFSADRFRTMIRFNTGMMMWFERRYGLISKGFAAEWDWDELCDAADVYRQNLADFDPGRIPPGGFRRLPFKTSRSDSYLFFPPYKRPENRNHFELISFRLGFPGVSLAVTDTCWSFLVRTELNMSALEMFRREYFPSIGHENGPYSFAGMAGVQRPHSDAGEQWIVLDLESVEVVKSLTIFDASGRVKRLPSSLEILQTLSTRRPDRAA